MKTKLENYTREQLIEWLVSNDSNGTYTDESSRGEGLEPLTKEQALQIALAQLEESE